MLQGEIEQVVAHFHDSRESLDVWSTWIDIVAIGGRARLGGVVAIGSQAGLVDTVWALRQVSSDRRLTWFQRRQQIRAENFWWRCASGKHLHEWTVNLGDGQQGWQRS